MDLVLTGPPGSGKSAVGRRIAARRGIPFVDVDDAIEAAAGRPIQAIFETEGEAGFRRREREAIDALGPGLQLEHPSEARSSHRARGEAAFGGREDGSAQPTEGTVRAAGPACPIARVVAAGGGAVVDPVSRWMLFRGRRPVTLWAPPDVLLRRLRGGPVRPLLAGQGPRSLLAELLSARERWYAAAEPVDATGTTRAVADRIEALLATPAPEGTTLLRADTPIGRITIGHGDAVRQLLAVLAMLDARRVAVVSEPQAWRLHGRRIAAGITGAGLDVVPLLVPRGEAAKSLVAYGRLVRAMASARLERRDPVVVIGGGALGDAGGFAAATYRRGVPLVQVPTTLVGQIDAAIGGKTAIDIPEGKNLVGAFHQPRAVVADVATLSTLAPRQLRAALGEAVKYGMLGDERLLALLEEHGAAIAAGSSDGPTIAALVELVERSAWAKVEVVTADEREQGGRIMLNLGHSIGHAIEGAAGYGPILHGEAVAYGLLGALAVGEAEGVTPPERGARIARLLASVGLALDPPPVDQATVRARLGHDKKHAEGRLHWVLPTAAGVVVRCDVRDESVSAGIDAALRGVDAEAAAARAVSADVGATA